MMIVTSGGKKASIVADEAMKAGSSIPMFIQQCESIERLKKHLLAASSSSDDENEDSKMRLSAAA